MFKKFTRLCIFFTIILGFSQSFAKPTPAFIQQALKSHNDVRAKVKQKPLIWSNDLQQISQNWANKLASECKIYHHKGKIPFGENLFWTGGTTNISNAIYAWANEKNYYNYQKNTCQKGKVCGHYTQMVWKGTTDVGCAKQACPNGKGEVYVCSYWPSGNFVGARPY